MRAILWISAMKPELVTRSINYVSTRSRGEYYMVTDASTSVGGDGTIAQMRTDQTPGAIIRTGIIRWCKFAEMTAINSYNQEFLELAAQEPEKASINVLEFFVVLYLTVANVDLLKGCVVHTRCDNTAAVSWINKLRGSNKSQISILLLRTFALVCFSYNIHFSCTHISGELNVLADWLSRTLTLQEADPMPAKEGWIQNTELVTEWQNASRSMIVRRGRYARSMLGAILNWQEEALGAKILMPITKLTGDHGALAAKKTRWE